MWLENFPKVRVQKYQEWYAVEIQKSYFWISYWTHIESVTWIPSQPWYFKTKEDAIEVAQLNAFEGIKTENFLENSLIRLTKAHETVETPPLL